MNNRIVVLGAGISGVGAAVLAKRKGFNVFVSDHNKISSQNKKYLKIITFIGNIMDILNQKFLMQMKL